jgi:hypothetical protein
MANLLQVQIFHYLYHLLKYFPGCMLRKAAYLVQTVEELTALAKVFDQVEKCFVFVGLVKLYDIWVV